MPLEDDLAQRILKILKFQPREPVLQPAAGLFGSALRKRHPEQVDLLLGIAAHEE